MASSINQIIQESIIDSFKGLKSEVWYLAVVQLINRAGLMVVPFMTLYLTKELDWTYANAGIATMFFGVGSLTGSLIGGYLSNKYDDLKIITIGLFFTGLAFFVMAFITDFYLLCFWIWLTSSIGDSVRPSFYTAVARFSAKDNITRGISLIRLAINLGIAVGPAVGGLLIEYAGYQWIFFMDGVTCVAASIFMFYRFMGKKGRQYEEDEKSQGDFWAPYLDWKFMLFMILNLINLTVFFQILFTVPLFFEEYLGLSEKYVGYFFIINGLMVCALEMPLVFYLEKRKRLFLPVALGAVLIGFAFGTLLIPVSFWIIFTIYNILLVVGEVINFPFINAVGIKRAGEKNIGTYNGSISVVFSICFILAPGIGVPLLDIVSFEQFFIGCMIISILSGLAIYFTRGLLQKDFAVIDN